MKGNEIVMNPPVLDGTFWGSQSEKGRYPPAGAIAV